MTGCGQERAMGPVAGLVQRFMARKPVRTGSMVVTLFGDSIAPRGGEVWLGSVIDVLAGIGVSERMVRTAVFRLTREGILENERSGRRSYYRLTAAGREQFEAATARIYFADPAAADGGWTLVLLGQLAAAERARVRRELAWLGFGALAGDVLAHPGRDARGAAARLRDLGVADRVPVLAGAMHEASMAGLAGLAERAWNLAGLERAYAEFVRTFEPLDRLTEAAPPGLGDAECFYLRTFLVHDYRRIMLRDPALPDELLPADWHGRAAYALAARLYRRIAVSSERFVDRALVGRSGPLPPPDPGFRRRFGGLGEGC